jgi:hypothetical protein
MSRQQPTTDAIPQDAGYWPAPSLGSLLLMRRKRMWLEKGRDIRELTREKTHRFAIEQLAHDTSLESVTAILKQEAARLRPTTSRPNRGEAEWTTDFIVMALDRPPRRPTWHEWIMGIMKPAHHRFYE